MTLRRGIDPQGHQLRGIVQAQKNHSHTTTPRAGFKPTIQIYEEIKAERIFHFATFTMLERWYWNWTVNARVMELNLTEFSLLKAKLKMFLRMSTFWKQRASLFFTNLIHKFFILIHLLHSSTCFEQYCACLQDDNCISTASDIVSLFRWLFRTQVTRGLL